jgi:diguanylate cyclase (GGDEF)-like protein/PAS domain S-box-containing protein
MSGRIWFALYWIWMTLLAALFYAEPGWHIPIWSTIGVSSAGAVVVGVIRNKPRRTLPWILLAIGLVSFAAGDTTYNLLTSVGHEVNPFPSAADLFYVVTCISQTFGIYLLVRAGTANRDRSTLIDSLVLTSGVGVIYWIFLIAPNVHRDDFGTLQKIISVAYPLADILILALVSRLIVTAHRSPAVRFLAVGTAGLLTADVVYGLSQLHAGWAIGGPIDIGWVILYACWGAAALHPSMAALTTPRTARPVEMGRTRLTLLAVSSLVAPAALAVEAELGHIHDAIVIAAMSAIVFLLIMVRLSDVLRSNRRALARERALRQAGDAMVSATDLDGVRSAVEVAIDRIIPDAAIGFVDRLPTAAGAVSADEVRSGTVARGTVPSGGSAGPPELPTGATIRYTSLLGPDLPEALRNYELALVCPLSGRQPVAAREATGSTAMPFAVVLGAAEDVLATMKSPLEVLTAQATLALGRIVLTEEINRRKSEEYFRTLVQNTTDVILIVDEHDAIGYASPSAAGIFGDQPIIGRPLSDLVTVDHSIKAGNVIALMRAKSLATDGPERNGTALSLPAPTAPDWVVQRRDGVVMHVEASTQDLTDDATVQGIVVTLRDVTERRRLERELTHLAFHDPLTGVANRLLFQERVKTAVAGALRHGGTVGVLFIDLDDFKIVNDTMGHQAGDQLLVSVVERLGRILRPQDTAARLGGDEFAALIEDVSDPAEVERIAEAIISGLSEPFYVGDSIVSGVSSIGVATTAEAGDAQELLRQADLALYVAKGSGKGQWRSYQPALHTAVLKRMQIRTELDQAVKDGSFELHYQPIVDLNSMLPVGFEALVRWNHPISGQIPPAEFIDIAEESGIILTLGDWVMRTAIETAAAWDDPDLYVSVNVSVRQFRAPGFVETVQAHLAAAGLPPSRLMVEITESLLLPDEQQVWDDLSTLRTLGIRIAIDDFGTGYSSLSYLRRVPIDVVKVDRSFVETIGTSEPQRALVEGIVWLAGNLGLSVIAEGIETRADRDLLVSLGCPMGQGYFFSRPLSRKASMEWRNAVRVAA